MFLRRMEPRIPIVKICQQDAAARIQTNRLISVPRVIVGVKANVRHSPAVCPNAKLYFLTTLQLAKKKLLSSAVIVHNVVQRDAKNLSNVAKEQAHVQKMNQADGSVMVLVLIVAELLVSGEASVILNDC